MSEFFWNGKRFLLVDVKLGWRWRKKIINLIAMRRIRGPKRGFLGASRRIKAITSILIICHRSTTSVASHSSVGQGRNRNERGWNIWASGGARGERKWWRTSENSWELGGVREPRPEAMQSSELNSFLKRVTRV